VIQLSSKHVTQNLLPSHLTLTHGPNGQFHSYIMAEKHRRWMPATPYAYKKEIKMQLVPGWKTEIQHNDRPRENMPFSREMG